MVSHESLDGLLRLRPAGGARLDGLADRAQRPHRRRLRPGRVHHRVGGRRVPPDRRPATCVRVPLGVDLAHFHPAGTTRRCGPAYARPDELLLLHCARLSPEKRPERSLAALAALRVAGVPAVLVVVGNGPRRGRLRARPPGRAERAVRGPRRRPGSARRAAGHRRRRARARPGGDVRAGRAGGTGQRHAGRGQRPTAPCRRWSATPGWRCPVMARSTPGPCWN